MPRGAAGASGSVCVWEQGDGEGVGVCGVCVEEGVRVGGGGGGGGGETFIFDMPNAGRNQDLNPICPC